MIGSHAVSADSLYCASHGETEWLIHVDTRGWQPRRKLLLLIPNQSSAGPALAARSDEIQRWRPLSWNPEHGDRCHGIQSMGTAVVESGCLDWKPWGAKAPKVLLGCPAWSCWDVVHGNRGVHSLDAVHRGATSRLDGHDQGQHAGRATREHESMNDTLYSFARSRTCMLLFLLQNGPASTTTLCEDKKSRPTVPRRATAAAYSSRRVSIFRV